MLKAILEYQKKDGQLVTIEREIASSKAKKVVNHMVNLIKTAQQKLVLLEKNAQDLISQFNELMTNFEKEHKVVETFFKQKKDEASIEELVEQEKKANDANANLLILEKNISKLSKAISDKLKEFESTKNEGVQAKKRYTQGRAEYDALVQSKGGEVKKLKKELSELEQSADPKYMAKYKEMREDRKFPIFVPLLGNSCGGCSMELAILQQNKLEENSILECENCHRIIYRPSK